ncbi:hypothetical protein VTK73DRAFT_7616 [Phialemonium thermophilum]|uniref:Uncharacterized protein n=1 Tax=Phialemonium thermophilum TaxID=223376 RepID=A0ABR3Y7R7_9PEZI
MDLNLVSSQWIRYLRSPLNSAARPLVFGKPLWTVGLGAAGISLIDLPTVTTPGRSSGTRKVAGLKSLRSSDWSSAIDGSAPLLHHKPGKV